MDKNQRIILLLDYYRELLTPKQKDYMELYYEEDLSLQEIAENMNVSRNAVHDAISQSIKSLERYEQKLHLLDKDEQRKGLYQQLRSLVNVVEVKEIINILEEI